MNQLEGLIGKSIRVSDAGGYPDPGTAEVEIVFGDGAWLRADYWRIIKSDHAGVSSFDHNQQYGLPSPVDAFASIREELEGKVVSEAAHDRRTGDLRFRFGDVELQIFNFTGYEVWQIHFSDGTVEYSPYAI